MAQRFERCHKLRLFQGEDFRTRGAFRTRIYYSHSQAQVECGYSRPRLSIGRSSTFRYGGPLKDIVREISESLDWK